MNYKDVNDYEILYLIKDSDIEYKDVVFEKYNPIIKKIAANYSAVNKIPYDEVYSECLVGLNNAINSFNDKLGCSFYTFANRCIYSCLFDYKKSLNTKKSYAFRNAISFDEYDLYNVIADSVNVYEIVASDANNYLIIEFKNSLDFPDSAIFELKYNGFSFKEIALLLDIKFKVVRNRVRTINNKIKKSNISKKVLAI